ncbi:MAG: hypothetical protein JRJ54_05815 [Deltaproteobacteria bacterium]|nr:hypothetical protein [Deltaproteobacteria bacterium]
MPTILGASLHTLRVIDNLSGSEIELTYRMPTTKERAAYTSESFRRERNRLVTRLVETRLKYGAQILTGIRDGDFAVEKDGAIRAISSNAASPHYDPEWKEKVVQYAGHLVEILAATVFEGSAEAQPETVPEVMDHEDAEKN